MDPTKSATLFFQRLIAVPGWQSLPPSEAANKVQINADPNYYTSFYTAAQAIVTSLTGSDAACATGISANAQGLAQNLVTAIDAGKIVGAVPDHLKEIRWIAAGQTVPNCGIDVGILQVITIAYNTFGRIGISDINRACTGQIEGAGTASAHYANGGGHAVDFYSLGGTATNGADANATRLLKALDPIMPKNSDTGQSECRSAAGDSLTLGNMGQFEDTCTHVHVQVDPNNPAPLNLEAEPARLGAMSSLGVLNPREPGSPFSVAPVAFLWRKDSNDRIWLESFSSHSSRRISAASIVTPVEPTTLILY